MASALLDDADLTVGIDFVERAAKPDGLLRHGPVAGVQRLHDVAARVDAILADDRVRFFGSIDVGEDLDLAELRRHAHAVVLTTGAPQDLALDVAGQDSVGVGTVSHLEAWLAGSADVDVDELDLAMDTAVFIGASAESIRAAEALCGRVRRDLPAAVGERLADSKLRHVQVVDSRSEAALDLPDALPENLVLRTELTPVGVVGRNRARALRCLRAADRDGRVISEDIRAQLLMRPRTTTFPWTDLRGTQGFIAHDGSRVLRGGTPLPGLYVAGWAGRGPSECGSHQRDAAAVLAAVREDGSTLSSPDGDLADRAATSDELGVWSAVRATSELLERFSGEGRAPKVDYEELIEQVDDD